jgi:hypothetical protein
MTFPSGLRATAIGAIGMAIVACGPVSGATLTTGLEEVAPFTTPFGVMRSTGIVVAK